VDAELPPLPESLSRFECRNHRLTLAALKPLLPEIEMAKAKFQPHRIAVVAGSSTSGIDSSETALFELKAGRPVHASYNYEDQHEMGSLARFIATVAGTSGPAYTVSTACSSSARVFLSAAELLHAGLCDAVIAGGADALCQLTLNGFDALASLSAARCNPLSENRDGLNIGEGAAFFLLTREDAALRFLGGGESDDAHHMNAPHPEGLGAEAAMRQALRDAALEPGDVGYINLHGTATPLNDAMESKAVARIFGTTVPVSSSKPLTGHCLGAAGAVEAALLCACLSSDRIPPPHLWDGKRDPELPALRLVPESGAAPAGGAWMSNSFAFGGNNCSLLFGTAS
jgi:3-oxoacyl-[acyl-carrier-protein] synthase-1